MNPFEDRPERILLSHGGGGLATGRLVRQIFLRHLDNPELARLDDGARLTLSNELAISTDAFVIDPLFFPGGDIGRLAVCGTLNDVAMCGAAPRALSAAFILEEGLEWTVLDRVVESLAQTARAAEVPVVTGDTKVVPRGKADRLYITTTGLGERLPGVRVGGDLARPGDRLLVSGPVGDHGATIMGLRAGLELSEGLVSDCASVAPAVLALLAEVPSVRCLRDPTRGGLVAGLSEIAQASTVAMQVDEAAVPVAAGTRMVCELLGLDPLQLPCEGRFLVVVPELDAERALALLRGRAECARAAEIGWVTDGPAGRVIGRTAIGGQRLLQPTEGELLPRIC